MEKENNGKLWVTLIVALFTLAVSSANIYLQYYYRQQDLEVAVKNKIIQQRQEALFEALEVIDNVYANTNFLQSPNFKNKSWSIQKARTAMNKMIIYCAEPQITVDLFYKAIGLFNPKIEKPKEINAGGIQRFRVQVAKELNLPAVIFSDSSHTWISQLPGGN